MEERAVETREILARHQVPAPCPRGLADGPLATNEMDAGSTPAEGSTERCAHGEQAVLKTVAAARPVVRLHSAPPEYKTAIESLRIKETDRVSYAWQTGAVPVSATTQVVLRKQASLQNLLSKVRLLHDLPRTWITARAGRVGLSWNGWSPVRVRLHTDAKSVCVAQVVEQPAGARALAFPVQKLVRAKNGLYNATKWSRGATASTSLFHSDDAGSIPAATTKKFGAGRQCRVIRQSASPRYTSRRGRRFDSGRTWGDPRA